MRDVVHWLRKLAALVEADHAPQHVVMHMRAGADEIERLRTENERLRIENIQMQAALGYAIMAEDERHILPTNPYKCGTCDASSYLRAENERLWAALKEIESITVYSGGNIHGISAPAWQAAFNHAHIVARAALESRT